MERVRHFARDLRQYESISRRRALEALWDDAKRDITTEALAIHGHAKARIIAEEPGILCGLPEALSVLRPLHAISLLQEGSKFNAGQAILEFSGTKTEILRRERTALNYLGLLSGIATETGKWVAKIGKGKVAAIRKNHPLLTESEKRAVQAGGGLAHRMNLSDGYLIKNTHLDFVRKRGKLGMGEAVREAVKSCQRHRRKTKNHHFVEAEVMSKQEAVAAAKAGADAILIDNQKPERFAAIVREVRKVNQKIVIEASGGITPENAEKYIHAGADFVSTSYLVMRARPIRMHLKLMF
ncbi:MAG TPA: carboxylating nicotinate-nucleotide diphosphorylase [Candidatus Norongarragalinales archaeon]|nr:carboxylating nicotinate-nucleotide diphosphorylase [Candidatus Norongarragalinales archaeon]